MTIRLKSPRVRVVLGEVDDPATWTEHTVQCIGVDIAATERQLGLLKLGSLNQNQILGQAMFGYFAMRRLGLLPPGTSFADFEQAYIEVTDPDDGPETEARPTPPAAGPES